MRWDANEMRMRMRMKWAEMRQEEIEGDERRWEPYEMRCWDAMIQGPHLPPLVSNPISLTALTFLILPPPTCSGLPSFATFYNHFRWGSSRNQNASVLEVICWATCLFQFFLGETEVHDFLGRIAGLVESLAGDPTVTCSEHSAQTSWSIWLGHTGLTNSRQNYSARIYTHTLLPYIELNELRGAMEWNKTVVGPFQKSTFYPLSIPLKSCCYVGPSYAYACPYVEPCWVAVAGLWYWAKLGHAGPSLEHG